MIINDEEKNAFTQSVMGDSEGGGSAVSICECEIDFNTGRVELLEKASVLYEQKKKGVLIAHSKIGMGSDTAYQETYIDISCCTNAVNTNINSYNFYMIFGDGGIVTLSASAGDNHPVGYLNLGNG